MAKLFETLQAWFSPVRPLPAGMYHYISPAEDPRNYRLHLRVEEDGTGVLILNAGTILHLNETATEITYYIIKNLSPKDAAEKIAARYHVTKEQAQEDYQNLVDRFQMLINTPDLDPETFLDFNRVEAHTRKISAPYRLDCALTYRLSSGAAEDAPTDRVSQELTTAEWKKLMDTALAAGIPHIVFTGGEPTLRPDLAELIGHAESNDQVSGLISDGLCFTNKAYLDQILGLGLDHIMIVLDPDREQIWSALENLLAADIFLAVHLTIRTEMNDQISELLSRLANIGIKAISLSTDQPELGEALEAARNLVAAHHMELVWNLPVPYSALHPVALETVAWEQVPGAGRDWLYVEPDGDVLPAQGLNQVLGNLLNDPWEKVWKR